MHAHLDEPFAHKRATIQTAITKWEKQLWGAKTTSSGDARVNASTSSPTAGWNAEWSQFPRADRTDFMNFKPIELYKTRKTDLPKDQHSQSVSSWRRNKSQPGEKEPTETHSFSKRTVRSAPSKSVTNPRYHDSVWGVLISTNWGIDARFKAQVAERSTCFVFFLKGWQTRRSLFAWSHCVLRVKIHQFARSIRIPPLRGAKEDQAFIYKTDQGPDFSFAQRTFIWTSWPAMYDMLRWDMQDWIFQRISGSWLICVMASSRRCNNFSFLKWQSIIRSKRALFRLDFAVNTLFAAILRARSDALRANYVRCWQPDTDSLMMALIAPVLSFVQAVCPAQAITIEAEERSDGSRRTTKYDIGSGFFLLRLSFFNARLRYDQVHILWILRRGVVWVSSKFARVYFRPRLALLMPSSRVRTLSLLLRHTKNFCMTKPSS